MLKIYIGGGTPTTLEPHHLKAIFDRLKANFDFSKIKEFTLEAGRPDTITKDKLYEAKQGGVNRISINPQTMNEQTLKESAESILRIWCENALKWREKWALTILIWTL